MLNNWVMLGLSSSMTMQLSGMYQRNLIRTLEDDDGVTISDHQPKAELVWLLSKKGWMFLLSKASDLLLKIISLH